MNFDLSQYNLASESNSTVKIHMKREWFIVSFIDVIAKVNDCDDNSLSYFNINTGKQ